MSNIVYINDTLYALVDMWNIYSVRAMQSLGYTLRKAAKEEIGKNQITGHTPTEQGFTHTALI